MRRGPFLQGARLTAWELQQDGIADDADHRQHGGAFLEEPDASAAWWWAPTASPPMATSRTRSGLIRVAVLAKENGIPFYVAAPISTLDLTLASGDQIPIESALPREVTHVFRACTSRRRAYAVAESRVRRDAEPLRDRDRHRARRGARAVSRKACKP